MKKLLLGVLVSWLFFTREISAFVASDVGPSAGWATRQHQGVRTKAHQTHTGEQMLRSGRAPPPGFPTRVQPISTIVFSP